MRRRVKKLLGRGAVAKPSNFVPTVSPSAHEDRLELQQAKQRMARKWREFDAIVAAHQQGDLILRGHA